MVNLGQGKPVKSTENINFSKLIIENKRTEIGCYLKNFLFVCFDNEHNLLNQQHHTFGEVEEGTPKKDNFSRLSPSLSLAKVFSKKHHYKILSKHKFWISIRLVILFTLI